MNDLMSAGTHRLWKDKLVSMVGLGAALRTDSKYIPRHLDVAGGTGDIAFRVGKITLDICFLPDLICRCRLLTRCMEDSTAALI